MSTTQVEMFVHFDDGDPAGITFFANYFRMSERAFELGLIKNGIEWKEWFHHPDWGVPLKKVEAEYHNMLTPGQTCRIHMGVKNLGESSLTLQFEFYDAKDVHCATVRTTHVFVDKKQRKKRPIPDHLRGFLESQKL